MLTFLCVDLSLYSIFSVCQATQDETRLVTAALDEEAAGLGRQVAQAQRAQRAFQEQRAHLQQTHRVGVGSTKSAFPPFLPTEYAFVCLQYDAPYVCEYSWILVSIGAAKGPGIRKHPEI